MPAAFFTQPANLRVSAGETAGVAQKAIASLQVPHGAYVVVAKFTVAVGAGPDNDLQPRISQFNLTFGGKTDLSWCHLNQGGRSRLRYRELRFAGSAT